ncbi:acyl-CoA dehydrogenase family protein, partial [Acinetobacter baumannii]|nr:acyl-CoA dehydrogenase family protein [Acinetobacter baumannii]
MITKAAKPDPIAPKPPELASPWHSAARAALQAEARAFASETVLPLADVLDRQKAEMPRSLIDAMAAKGWFGITIPEAQGGL